MSRRDAARPHAPFVERSCRDRSHDGHPSARCCPACRGFLAESSQDIECLACGRSFPVIAGIADLRLSPDRYLPLDAERGKARRLADLAERTDFAGLATAYYAMTDDVDPSRRARYLAHLAHAEERGEILAECLPAGGRVLEVGCGSGGLLRAARKQAIAIEGVDIAMRWLMLAWKRLDECNILTAANADALPWPDGTFDAVVADSVIEHLDDPKTCLEEWLRVTKPGGRLVLWSPNRDSLLPDPHVGLWGLGWLPTAWQAGYVRARRGCAWPVKPYSAGGAASMIEFAGWTIRRVEAAPAPRRHRGRIAIRLYETMRQNRLTSPALRRLGPLWQIVATRGPSA